MSLWNPRHFSIHQDACAPALAMSTTFMIARSQRQVMTFMQTCGPGKQEELGTQEQWLRSNAPDQYSSSEGV